MSKSKKAAAQTETTVAASESVAAELYTLIQSKFAALIAHLTENNKRTVSQVALAKSMNLAYCEIIEPLAEQYKLSEVFAKIYNETDSSSEAIYALQKAVRLLLALRFDDRMLCDQRGRISFLRAFCETLANRESVSQLDMYRTIEHIKNCESNTSDTQTSQCAQVMRLFNIAEYDARTKQHKLLDNENARHFKRVFATNSATH